MKVVLDFLALVLFFVVYYATRDIRVATMVAIVAGIFQAAFIWLKFKKMEVMQWVSLVLIVVFGGLTVLSHNDIFIKWKPSLLFWAMSLGVASGMLLKKNVLKIFLGKEIELPEFAWRHMAWSWTVFFSFDGSDQFMGGISL